MLIADRIAETTGIAVYVPDIFFGEAIDVDTLPIPDSAAAARAQGIVAKIVTVAKLATHSPWFIRHRPAQHLAQAHELIKVLKEGKGVKKLGAVGYCYGAFFTTHFNATGDVDASVLCHPSLLKLEGFEKLRAPTSVALAEEDHAVDRKFQAQFEEVLKCKDFETEVVLYPGTAHGFACRPNLAIEEVNKAFQGSLAQMCSFFKRHLI
ncbi:alpha/beta-hydrolase [Punctularia strigosozonata HHB-11173 SS5]|uniref:alpha/beta-hydrolase n=1 Tax=Punctularia strigosozonata (strain HHB-11173) TaxID=741275 RepID=UPI000441822D|nr:alpha/beta-hydrolase [Punctularia strigosozonata HHB-11173 SS5]EIN06151.1 alpha/beta-hydrolase [Punctularia strigosozonata HHB-11173 SS5]